jgi:type VI secretion system protein ImpH
VLGPLDLTDYLDLLPIGQGFRSLTGLARFYLQHTLDSVLRLTLKAAEVPRFCLGGHAGARLGWTTFLKTQPVRGDEEVGCAIRLGSGD